jgi:hypothetical protein
MLFSKLTLSVLLLAAASRSHQVDAFCLSSSSRCRSSNLQLRMLENPEDYYAAFGESSSSSHFFPTQGNLNPPAKPLKRYGEEPGEPEAAATSTVTQTEAVPGFMASYTTSASSISGKMKEPSYKQPQPGTVSTSSSPYSAQADLYSNSPNSASRIAFQTDKDGMMLEHDVLPRKNRFVPLTSDAVSSGSDMTTTHGKTSGAFRKIAKEYAHQDAGQNINLGEVVPTPKKFKRLTPDAVSSGSDSTTLHTRVGAFRKLAREDPGQNQIIGEVVPTPKFTKPLTPDTVSSGSDSTTAHDGRIGYFRRLKEDAGQNLVLGDVLPTHKNDVTHSRLIGAFRKEDAAGNRVLGSTVPTPQISPPLEQFKSLKFEQDSSGMMMDLGSIPKPRPIPPLTPHSVKGIEEEGGITSQAKSSVWDALPPPPPQQQQAFKLEEKATPPTDEQYYKQFEKDQMDSGLDGPRQPTMLWEQRPKDFAGGEST